MIVHPTEFLQCVRVLCDEHQVLLITMKCLPVLGVAAECSPARLRELSRPDVSLQRHHRRFPAPRRNLVTEEIHNEFAGPGKSFFHGHSYTGNPLACAAAVANLEILRWKMSSRAFV